MTYAFMLGALIIGLGLGGLAIELLVVRPLRQTLFVHQRLFGRK